MSGRRTWSNAETGQSGNIAAAVLIGHTLRGAWRPAAGGAADPVGPWGQGDDGEGRFRVWGIQ